MAGSPFHLPSRSPNTGVTWCYAYSGNDSQGPHPLCLALMTGEFNVYRLFSLCLLLLASLTAQAADTGWLQTPDHPPVQVRLVQNGPLDNASGQYAALLQVKLA